jgi:hypothetical protein
LTVAPLVDSISRCQNEQAAWTQAWHVMLIVLTQWWWPPLDIVERAKLTMVVVGAQTELWQIVLNVTWTQVCETCVPLELDKISIRLNETIVMQMHFMKKIELTALLIHGRRQFHVQGVQVTLFLKAITQNAWLHVQTDTTLISR